MSIFKIVLPGSSITSNNPRDIVVDSRYPALKIDTLAKPPHAGIIYLNWTSTTPIPGGTLRTIYSFPHGYDHIPSALGLYNFDNGSTKISGMLLLQYGALGVITIDTDQTNVNLKYLSIDSGSNTIDPFTLQVRFYIFAERGHV